VPSFVLLGPSSCTALRASQDVQLHYLRSTTAKRCFSRPTLCRRYIQSQQRLAGPVAKDMRQLARLPRRVQKGQRRDGPAKLPFARDNQGESARHQDERSFRGCAEGGRSPTGGASPGKIGLTPVRGTDRLVIATDWVCGWISSSKGSTIARPPCHRSPDEALHEVPTDRRAAGGGGEGIDQHGHGLSLRAGSQAASARRSAGPPPPRIPSPHFFESEVRADLLTGGARLRRGSPSSRRCSAPSRSVGRHPTDPGAPHPLMAGHFMARNRKVDLPPGP